MRKAFAAVLILTVILTGCGYKMKLTGMKANFTIFPAHIDNMSEDIEVTSIFSDEINVNLSSINALGKNGRSTYNGDFVLSSLTTTGASSTSSTTTAYVNMKISVRLTDNKGVTVMNRVFSDSEEYSNSTSISESRTNREEAIRNAIEKIMTDLRNAIERK